MAAGYQHHLCELVSICGSLTSGMMGDLQSKSVIILKGVLFVFLGTGAAGLLLFKHWSWENALLLGIVIWAFARAYYFAFYVIEKYVDPSYKFAGIWTAVAFLIRRRRDK